MKLPSAAVRVLFVLWMSVVWAHGQNPADPGVKDPQKFDAKRPLAQELNTNIPDGFTMVAVGDCILSRPVSQYAARDAAFAQVVQVLKRADVTYGNMETSILDIRQFRGFPYPGPDDMSLVAQPGVAKDMAAMGFDIVSRANNHALDWGVEGMRETSRLLDEASVAYAGTGESEGLARAAGFFESAKVRIGLVSMASTFRPGSEALEAHGAAPGRPGISGLHLKKTTVVTAEQMAALTRTRKAFYPDQKDDGAKELSLFGDKFVVGKAFGYQYEMDEADLTSILRGVRQGKQHSDFLIASIHSHEPANSSAPEPLNDFNDTPAEFLQELAHQAIDSGADVFVTTGIHHLGPIEIYKGHPIIYGMGNFYWGDIQEPVTADLYQLNKNSLTAAFEKPERATDADLNNLMNASAFPGGPVFDSLIAESRFERGKVAEIRLYPVDLGYRKKLTESGLPRMAEGERGKKILERVRELSQKYGTEIRIESSGNGFVGVVHP